MSNAAVQLMSVVAMFAGAWGSMLFVDTKERPADYELGSKVFLIGNIANIVIGLHIGELSLVIAQCGLAVFTIPMYDDRETNMVLSVYALFMIIFFPVANHFSFTASVVSASASVVAVYGAWAMSKAKWNTMNWCWVVADLVFIYVAIEQKLLGLGIVATLFVWHGFLRIMGWKRTGLFTFER